MSVTSSVDALAKDEAGGDEAAAEIPDIALRSIRKENAVRAFWRIGVAKAEMACTTQDFKSANACFVEFLFLRCAIEVDDDSLVASVVFGDKNAVKRLITYAKSGVERAELMIGHCAKRAEAKGMRTTAKALYEMVGDIMVKRAEDSKVQGAEESGEPTCWEDYGSFQRSILNLCDGVEESVTVFARVEETAAVTPALFCQEDLDWFVVEAYNR